MGGNAESAEGEPEVEAQQYVLKDITTGTYSRANLTLWHGEQEKVLYRRQFFHYNLETESHWTQAVNLADFTVPYGILRVDKLRLHRRPVSLTLGSYGFPDNGTEDYRKDKGRSKGNYLKGKRFYRQRKTDGNDCL